MKKYLSNDGSFSFQYPAEWTVDDSQPRTFDLLAPSGEEDVTLVLLPLVRDQSPTDYVHEIVREIRSGAPDLRFSVGKADDAGAYFELTFTRGFELAAGSGLVLKENDHAICVLYRTAAAKFNRRRGNDLLGTISSSSKWGQQAQDSASSLVGKWSKTISGNIAAFNSSGDSATGGESYEFLANGTFRHVHFGFGPIVSGVSTDTGGFVVHGNTLTLHATANRFQPADGGGRPESTSEDETNRYRWYFEDAQTLVLIDTRYSSRESWYKVPDAAR